MRLNMGDTGDVHAEALAKGAEQAVIADCPQCADAYFELAKKLGATDEDVQDALRAVEARNERLLFNRRAFLKMSAAGVIMASVGLMRRGELHTAASERIASKDAVWVHAYRSPLPGSGLPQTRLIGVSASGAVIANIDPLVGTPLRSSDGSTVAVVSSIGDGRVSVTAYDAQTGILLRRLSADAPFGAVSPELINFDVVSAISADGKWIALLGHAMQYIPGTLRSVTKGGAYGVDEYTVLVGERVSSLTLEVLNLADGVSLGLKELESLVPSIGYAQPIFAEDSAQLLVSYLDDGQAVLRRFVFDDGSLTEQEANAISKDMLPYGIPSLAARPASTRFSADQGFVATFSSAEQALVIDAETLSVRRSVPVPRFTSLRGEPSLIVSMSGQEGYVVQPYGAAIQFVDLAGTTVDTVQIMEDAQRPSNGYPMVPFSAAAYQAQRGRVLLSHGLLHAGLSVVDASRQGVVDSWLGADHLAGVWSSPDEELVVAVDTNGALRMLDSSGQSFATIPIGSAIVNLL